MFRGRVDQEAALRRGKDTLCRVFPKAEAKVRFRSRHETSVVPTTEHYFCSRKHRLKAFMWQLNNRNAVCCYACQAPSKSFQVFTDETKAGHGIIRLSKESKYQGQ
jgi:hypothetical protein